MPRKRPGGMSAKYQYCIDIKHQIQVLETIPRPFSRRDPNELTVPLFEEFEVKIRNRKNISNQRYRSFKCIHAYAKCLHKNMIRALVVALKMTNDVVIPTEPTQDILDALQMSRRGPHRRVSEEPVIQLLKILFKDRPMWSIMGLFGLSCLNNLNSANERIVQQLLAHVAYRVGQPGAWHGTINVYLTRTKLFIHFK